MQWQSAVNAFHHHIQVKAFKGPEAVLADHGEHVQLLALAFALALPPLLLGVNNRLMAAVALAFALALPAAAATFHVFRAKQSNGRR